MQSKIFVLFLFVVAFAHGILTGSSPHRVTLAHGLCNLRFLLVVMLGHCLLRLLCLLARPLVGWLNIGGGLPWIHLFSCEASGGVVLGVLQQRAETLAAGQSRRQAQVFAWYPIIAPLDGGFAAQAF